MSVPPPPISIPPRSLSVPPRDARATSVPHRLDPLSPLDILSEYEREPFQRGLSPTPVKAGRWGPRSSEVAFDPDGNWFFAIPESILASLAYFRFAQKLLNQISYQHSQIHESKRSSLIFASVSFDFLNWNPSYEICREPLALLITAACYLYAHSGLPIYRGGFPRHNCLDNLLNPRASLPPSAVTRDPFWYDLGDLEGLRPFRASSYLPPSLRDSYLSPIKRRFLWTRHPIRPFGKYHHLT